MDVSHRLHVVGSQPSHEVSLPELPGAGSHEPALPDQVGEQVQRAPWLTVGTAAAGAVGGALLLRRGGGGLARTLLGGIAGTLGGLAAGTLAPALLRGDSAHRGAAVDAPVADPVVHERERVKVMTWNLHGGMGGPGKFGSSDEELDALADEVRREQPDVLLLQEVDDFATRSDHRDTLAELSERLHPDSAVGASPTTTVLGRDQHVAVMTFNGFRVQDARNVVHQDPRGSGTGVRVSSFLGDAKKAIGSLLGRDWSGGPRLQVRNTLDTMVSTPAGNDVRVLSGHYEWPVEGVDHQARQVGAVAGALDAWDGPVIWGADFNVESGSAVGREEHRIMGEAGLADSFDAAPADGRVPLDQRDTHPGRTNGSGIDRIYSSTDGTRVLETHVGREAGDASDHSPVITELELQPAAAS